MKATLALILSLCLLAILWLSGCGGPAKAEPEAGALPQDGTLPQQDHPGGQDPETGSGAETRPPDGSPAQTARTDAAPTDESASVPGPATEPTADTEPQTPESWSEAKLRQMTLEEKVAQMFIVTPEALTGISGAATVAGETTRASFDRIPVGGILYMGQNLETPAQTRALLSGMRQISLDRTGLVPFLCVDEEGGQVARIGGNPAFGVPKLPPMSELGKTGDPQTAREAGRTIGAYLRGLGFNLDFAPCADVLTNPNNQIVRSRSFGSDAAMVSQMVRAFSEGLLAEGILPCCKHFPGHGGTAEDSHEGFAVLHMDMEQLKNSAELAPFLDAAAWGAPMIMAGHISVPEATGDDRPASLSKTLLDLLRGEELGYEGLIVTDALDMGAISQRCGPGEAAVQAILAGNDLLLEAGNLQESYESVLAAVRDGSIPEDRIDKSVLRILRVKERLS